MVSFIPGMRFRVLGFYPVCDRAYRDQLLAMGFIPGAVFQVIRLAPLGDPLQVQIKGFSLSLRLKEIQSMYLEAIYE